MAELPDPTENLDARERAVYDHMAAARSHADGRPQLGQVYVRMFNNPGVAEKVGALGEHLRFAGTLPDAQRELIIVRYAARKGYWYEWAHHQRPAQQAGLDRPLLDAVTAGEIPGSLDATTRAVLEAVDAVVEDRSIPAGVQDRIVDAHGTAGVVELVALCGLYALMGAMVTAFDIPIEDGFPTPPRAG